jgi:hypothetical protein
MACRDGPASPDGSSYRARFSNLFLAQMRAHRVKAHLDDFADNQILPRAKSSQSQALNFGICPAARRVPPPVGGTFPIWAGASARLLDIPSRTAHRICHRYGSTCLDQMLRTNISFRSTVRSDLPH